jgi:hypothetical protein
VIAILGFGMRVAMEKSARYEYQGW